MMGGLSLICDAVLRLIGPTSLGDIQPSLEWMPEFRAAIENNFGWILTILGAGAVVYGLYLGINLARTDSTEKAQEAKKRIVNFFIGIAILIGLALLMYYLLGAIPTWFPA